MRAALLLSVLAACGSSGPSAARDPLRPRPTPIKKVEMVRSTPGDCDPVKPSEGEPARVHKDRSVEEAQAIATQGLELLQRSDKPVPEPEKNALLEQAVAKFHTALAADPYNVRATYNLAAAYARIGRAQCSINLLWRLTELSAWPSQAAAVKESVERLFGRGKKWKGNPDPDFDRLRGDERFRAVAKELD